MSVHPARYSGRLLRCIPGKRWQEGYGGRARARGLPPPAVAGRGRARWPRPGGPTLCIRSQTTYR